MGMVAPLGIAVGLYAVGGLCNIGGTLQPSLSEHVTLIGGVWVTIISVVHALEAVCKKPKVKEQLV